MRPCVMPPRKTHYLLVAKAKAKITARMALQPAGVLSACSLKYHQLIPLSLSLLTSKLLAPLADGKLLHVIPSAKSPCGQAL